MKGSYLKVRRSGKEYRKDFGNATELELQKMRLTDTAVGVTITSNITRDTLGK